MKAKTAWYDGNLHNRLELALRYLEGMLDASADQEPFFGINRQTDGTATANHAVHIGIPHVTGRACDLLYGIEASSGLRIAPEIEAEYVRYLFSCCEVDDHLPVYKDPARDNREFVEFHNLRECLEALVWLIQLRDSTRARIVAAGFLKTLAALTNPETGCLDYELAQAMGPEKAEKFASMNEPFTLSQGRLIGPLLLFYQLTGERQALQLASAYAQSTLRLCFFDDGRIHDRGHNHVHSITSTLTGILSYALLTGRDDMVQKVRNIYNVGLQEAMSEYGYVKEQLWIESEQGESNQVGDCIQLQLMFATCGQPAHWYACAEKFMRGGILPAQLLDGKGFITDVDNPQEDCQSHMAVRAVGGFGFPTPTTRLEHETGGVNTIDITQGAVQSICRFMEHIVVRENGISRLNLFFDTDNEVAEVKSELPLIGRVRIFSKQASVWAVRVPENIEPDSFRLEVAGEKVPYTVIEGYAYIDSVEAGTEIFVIFTPAKRVECAYISHKSYEVRWYGEQVADVLPHKGVCPLYQDFPVTF